MNIVAMVGSLRKDSFNRKVAEQLQGLAPEGASIEILTIGDLPLYNSDLEAAFPAPASALKSKIEAADAVVFVTPEYNRSIPGGLKNAIDWASRPWGKNSFAGKPALIMGVSIGKLGTALAQSDLRMVCEYLSMDAVTQPEVYLGPAHDILDDAGLIKEDSTKDLLKSALAALALKIKQNQNA